mgnify:CR=1 FL=1
MFRGKKYQESAKLIDKSAQYEAAEGMDLICKTAKAKFDETVELHVKLGVDSRHADQQVRGAIVLPHGTGKTQRVLVFAKAAKADTMDAQRPGSFDKKAFIAAVEAAIAAKTPKTLAQAAQQVGGKAHRADIAAKALAEQQGHEGNG